VESAASSMQLNSPPSSMSGGADPRRKGRSLLKKTSRCDRLEVSEGAYTLTMSSVPSDAAMVRPEGFLKRLVRTIVSRLRMAGPRRDVPKL
jgi:hypothetical protein